MKSLTAFLAVSVFACAVRGNDYTPTIYGQYVEVRSCDVYTGSCFANAEMGLTGEEAILTWSITNGHWHGVSLEGLSVIGSSPMDLLPISTAAKNSISATHTGELGTLRMFWISRATPEARPRTAARSRFASCSMSPQD